MRTILFIIAAIVLGFIIYVIYLGSKEKVINLVPIEVTEEEIETFINNPNAKM